MPEPTTPESTEPRPRWWKRPRTVFAGVLLLHLGLLLHFAPPAVMFSNDPLTDIDFPLHYYQVDRAVQAWDGWGKLWSYDPLQLAGHPIGALEDLSSKSLELWAIGLSYLGIHPAQALKLYVLLVHLLVPFMALLVGRLLRLSWRQVVGMALLWVLLWYFDSLFHWLWFCGMVSWAVSSYLIVLLVVLLYRALGEEPGRGDGRLWLAVAAVASLLALTHPYASLTLIAPCAGLYLRDIKRLSWKQHLALGLSLCAALATALIWLLPALKLTHYLLDESHFLHPSPDYLLWDYLDLMIDDLHTGPPVRTMLRVLTFATGVVVLWRWRREGDRRLLPLALLAGVALLWAYLGGFLPRVDMSQPYRHVSPATLAMTIPAVILLSQLLAPAHLRALSRPVKLLLLLALLLLVPRFVHNVLFYFPTVLPEPKEPGPMEQPRPSALVGFVEHRHFALRHHTTPEPARQVRAWLLEHLEPSAGRVAVQQFMLGEYLAASTRLPMLSGIEQRSIYHGDAYLFRLDEDGDLPGRKLVEYLQRYAVKYVVVTQVKPKLEWRKDLLIFRKMIGPMRIYETSITPSYFLKGKGKVVRQELNRIVVADASGPEVVLRFHWMESLRCRPGCTIEQHDVRGDRVGFIRIKNPPPRFEIYNSYRLDGPSWRPPKKVGGRRPDL